eukprot:11621588-Alexandrium_andersonii.AAC.1
MLASVTCKPPVPTSNMACDTMVPRAPHMLPKHPGRPHDDATSRCSCHANNCQTPGPPVQPLTPVVT